MSVSRYNIPDHRQPEVQKGELSRTWALVKTQDRAVGQGSGQGRAFGRVVGSVKISGLIDELAWWTDIAVTTDEQHPDK